jgi:hypothetical protein
MTQNIQIKWQKTASWLLDRLKEHYPENPKEWHEKIVKEYAEEHVLEAVTARIR